MSKVKGAVLERATTKGTVYALRFSAGEHGRQYVTLGRERDGWTRERADEELSYVIAQVQRGVWRPPRRATPDAAAAETRQMPTFGEFARQWLDAQKIEGGRRGSGLTEAGAADLTWRLRKHLLPHFARVPLDQITVEDVDQFRRLKVREGEIGATSINKVLATMAAVLELAVEYDLIAKNPARGRRRRLPVSSPRRTYLDRAEHITAMLDAAGELDAAARVQKGERRALLATLVFAGLRIGEALSLRWRDVNLARGTIAVRAAKTDAGVRTVDLLPVLRDELLSYRAGLGDVGRDALVFGTRTGKRQGSSNVRRRVLARAVELANASLLERELDPLPERLTPHGLRRTFASLLFAIGEPPPRVMGQMGHTTPALTLAIYAREMDRRDGEPERLRALVQGTGLALETSTPLPVPDAVEVARAA
ncbi:tyrosine-type recombinase/integrase [Baekduia sp.]|jgi:integrase|uniref:tyrosine-type recombinase/integrase n=1 Tax=Baekduia sp. TaxID=2600305 RepID=UPI002E0C2FAB|nr:tyrosine-type recombinase/integrase [Baekduia sp.]